MNRSTLFSFYRQLVFAIAFTFSVPLAAKSQKMTSGVLTADSCWGTRRPKIIIDALTYTRVDKFCETCISIGERLSIAVINLNPLLYKVTVNGEVKLEPLGTFEDPVAKLAAALNKLQSSTDASPDSSVKGKVDSESPFAATQLNQTYKELYAFAEALKKADAVMHSNRKQRYEILQELSHILLSLEGAPESLDLLKDWLPAKARYLLQSYSQAVQEAKSVSHEQLYKLSATQAPVFSELYSAISSVHQKQQSKAAQEQLIKRLKDSVEAFRQSVLQNEQKSSRVSHFVGLVQQQEQAITEADLVKVASDVAANVSLINAPCSFTFTRESICPDADTIIQTVQIAPIDSKINPRTAKDFVIPFSVGGGFRVFSTTNLMFSFGSLVRNETAYLEADSTVHTATSRANGLPSLALAANFFWNRNNCRVPRLGITLGISGNFAELSSFQDVRFFGGPTLVLGRKNKFILTAGVTAGWCDRLKGMLEDGRKASVAQLSAAGGTLTEKVFLIGGVTIGFGYKIF
jgi:hypothetical protein